MSKNRNVFYFTTGSAGRGYGHVWRVSMHETSFYVVGRHRGIDQIKVSLHGPREPGDDPWFKIDRARTLDDADESAIDVQGRLPITFEGEDAGDGARRVLRVRTTWDLFDGKLGGLGFEKPIKSRGLVQQVPPPGKAADMDFYITDGPAHVPAGTRENNALAGELRNGAGQTLTAIAYQRGLAGAPSPVEAGEYRPWGRSDGVRGVLLHVKEGLLPWIVETEMSLSRLKARDRVDPNRPPLSAVARRGLTFGGPLDDVHLPRSPLGYFLDVDTHSDR